MGTKQPNLHQSNQGKQLGAWKRDSSDVQIFCVSTFYLPVVHGAGFAGGYSVGRDNPPDSESRAHEFGGDWTREKLDIVRDYLEAYLTALKNWSFQKEYIDAFAGTGYISTRAGMIEGEPLFPELVEPEASALREGSAVQALKLDPGFDRYLLIENNRERYEALRTLQQEFPQRKIEVLHEEANSKIAALCAENWSGRRAVLFLDPYAMEVEWETLRAIARTHAIDLWILFPLMAVNRLLTLSGKIEEAWRQRLDRLFGTTDWYDAFYKKQSSIELDLFGDEQASLEKAGWKTIGEYFTKRLREIFPGVAPSPRVLRNTRGSPLYLLCFAAANEKGAPIAVNIASHLLKLGD